MKKYISIIALFLGGMIVALLFVNISSPEPKLLLNGSTAATLTPIKDPIPVRVPAGYDFSRVSITIDVMRNDQDGKFIDYESASLNLDDPIDRAKLTPTQLTKIEEVARALFKIANKIN